MLSINYVDFLLALITVVVGMTATKELLEKFCKAFGIEFSWIRQNRERSECEKKIKADLDAIRERQKTLEVQQEKDRIIREEFNKSVIESISALRVNLDDLSNSIERREAEKKFEKLRDDILSFANQLSSQDTINDELISHIYNKINTYEELQEKYKFQNNQTPASIAAITARYQQMLINGQVEKE